MKNQIKIEYKIQPSYKGKWTQFVDRSLNCRMNADGSISSSNPNATLNELMRNNKEMSREQILVKCGLSQPKYSIDIDVFKKSHNIKDYKRAHKYAVNNGTLNGDITKCFIDIIAKHAPAFGAFKFTLN